MDETSPLTPTCQLANAASAAPTRHQQHKSGCPGTDFRTGDSTNLNPQALYQGVVLTAPKKRRKTVGFNPCTMFVIPKISAFRFTKPRLGPVFSIRAGNPGK
jgi:hypothetical protein